MLSFLFYRLFLCYNTFEFVLRKESMNEARESIEGTF